MRVRALITGRAQRVGIGIALSNHIRGVMKTFGLVVPKGGGRIFETNVATLRAGQEASTAIILPLLETGAARCACKQPGLTANSWPWRARAACPLDDDSSQGRRPHRSVHHKHDRGSRQLQKRACSSAPILASRRAATNRARSTMTAHRDRAVTNASARCFTKQRYWG